MTPAVAAPYASAPQILGKGARIVPLEPYAWVDVLVPLLRDPLECSRWSDRARSVAREHSTPGSGSPTRCSMPASRSPAGEGLGVGSPARWWRSEP